MAQETVTEKAQRLLNERKVHVISQTPSAGVYVVQGDTKPYLVTVLGQDERERAQRLGGEPALCPCEAHGVCSHLLAADGMFRHNTSGGVMSGPHSDAYGTR